jgi:WD40 repeat protein
MKVLLVLLLTILSHVVAQGQNQVKWVRTNHLGPASSLALTPDDHFLVSTSELDSEIIIWSTLTNQFVKRFYVPGVRGFGPSDMISQSTLVAVTGTGLIFVNIKTGATEMRIALPQVKGAVVLAADPTARYIVFVSVYTNQYAYRYDLTSQSLDSVKLSFEVEPLTRILISPTCDRLIYPGWTSIYVVDLVNDTTMSMPLGSIGDPFYFINDVECVTSGRTQYVINIRDLTYRDTTYLSANDVYRTRPALNSTHDRLYVAPHFFTPEMSQYNGDIYVYGNENEPIAQLTGSRASVIAVNPLTQNVHVGGHDGATTYDSQDGQVVASSLNTMGSGGVNVMAFAQDGRFATRTYQTQMGVVDPDRINTPSKSFMDLNFPGSTSMAWDPIANRIALGSTVYDLDTVKIVTTDRDGAQGAWTPNGAYFFWHTHRDTFMRRDRVTGEERTYLTGHNSITDLKISPDGQWVATSGKDMNVRIWSIDGILIKLLEGHSATISSINFAPNSSQLVSGGMDTTIRIWDIATGQSKTVIGVLELPINVSITPDRGEVISLTPRSVIAYGIEGMLDVKQRTRSIQGKINASRTDHTLTITHDFSVDKPILLEVYDVLGRLLFKSEYTNAQTISLNTDAYGDQAVLVKLTQNGESASVMVPR